MKKTSAPVRFLTALLSLAVPFYLCEVLCVLLLSPVHPYGLVYSAFWSLLLAAGVLLLPPKAGRIVFGILLGLSIGWTLAQCGYYQFFGKLMWLSDTLYAGEGADYLNDIFRNFPALWFAGGVLLLGALIVLVWRFPRPCLRRTPWAVTAGAAVCILALLPHVIYFPSPHVPEEQADACRTTYRSMTSATAVYNTCGIYQLTVRDLLHHGLLSATHTTADALAVQRAEVDAYFAERSPHGDNAMTGIFAGKNVVLVQMESIDDWMITPEDTPTLYRLRSEGIHFTDFYTPGYGTARTLNTEFCLNTGIYLPTDGQYVFDRMGNTFAQSLPAQLTAAGYDAQVFHYNSAEFYHRGQLIPAMGYSAYNSYEAYTDDPDALLDENLLFEIPALQQLFFRDGLTFNTVITRSAHLSYAYNDELSIYALERYPQYEGLYASEEEDCARLKARLVDDFFTRLLQELEATGRLESTVIIAVTDHYTYGYKDADALLTHSGITDELLLEKTPCFLWSSGGPAMTVTKTACTADLVPTLLNLLGVDSPYVYLGNDVFDPAYGGWAMFPDGSWISGGIACRAQPDGTTVILDNTTGEDPDPAWLARMHLDTQAFIRISNLLLSCDYYSGQ